MSELKRIWLQPECCANNDGRMWCEHDEPVECPDGEPWVEYVRADEITRLRAENEDLRGVIEEYESDPDYARSRFREIDLLKDQRAHDRLKIQGMRARVEELEAALGPFAQHGEALEGCEPTDGWCEALTPDGERTHWLAVEHFFDARRALRGETDGS